MTPSKTLSPVSHEYSERQIILHPVQLTRSELMAMTDEQRQVEQAQADALIAALMPVGHRLLSAPVLGFVGTGPRSRRTRQKTGPEVRVIAVTIARIDAHHAQIDSMGRPVVPAFIGR